MFNWLKRKRTPEAETDSTSPAAAGGEQSADDLEAGDGPGPGGEAAAESPAFPAEGEAGGAPDGAVAEEAALKSGFWSRFKKRPSSSGELSPESSPLAGAAPEEGRRIGEGESGQLGEGRAEERTAGPGAPSEPPSAPEGGRPESAETALAGAGSSLEKRPVPEPALKEEPAAAKAEASAPEEIKEGFWKRFKSRLSATRGQLAGRMENLLATVREIDDDVLDELEEILITSDLGVSASQALLKTVKGKVASQELRSPEALKEAIRRLILEMITLPAPQEAAVKPRVVMVVGVNGVGKTTTIAKLARRCKEQGHSVLLAAGDTFRAAAVEQLTIWSQRLGVDIVAQPTGADPSAVVYDSLVAAQARKRDVIIIDTAGRLHTKVNLMDELKKIKRVAGKALPGAPHETLLVLDANTGQNALSQAKLFHEAVGVDGLALTKLDGTSKGGVVISICHELKIPVKYIGVGESYEDLRVFNPEEFSRALFED